MFQINLKISGSLRNKFLNIWSSLIVSIQYQHVFQDLTLTFLMGSTEFLILEIKILMQRFAFIVVEILVILL